MKYIRTRLLVVGAMAFAFTFSFNVLVLSGKPVLASVRSTTALQMGDMPYDLHFIDMMIMHYQDGIELLQLAQTKTQNPRIKAFAQKAEADETETLKEIRSRRDGWYAGRPVMDMSSMMQSMHPGMMSMDETRRKLRAAEGTAFDRAFLDHMIQHHQMALDMSNDAATKAEHPELRETARKWAGQQQAEITKLKALRGNGAITPTTPKRHMH